MTVFQRQSGLWPAVFYPPSKLIYRFRPSQRSQVSLMVSDCWFLETQERTFQTRDTFLHIMAHSVFFIFFFFVLSAIETPVGSFKKSSRRKIHRCFFRILFNLSLYANDKQNDKRVLLCIRSKAWRTISFNRSWKSKIRNRLNKKMEYKESTWTIC